MKNTSSDDNDFISFLKQQLKEMDGKPFVVQPYYNKDGDSIEVYLENVCSYAKWLNQNVTLFLAQDDKRIVGFEIEGISQLIKGNNSVS